MKTFLLSAVKRLKSYSQKLDAKSILYDKSWEVFNENGDKELMIFRTNQELLISRNGIIQKGKWELLDIANIIIDVGEKSYLFNASYIEDNFLALKLDGTEEYMVMIEADMMNRFSLNSVKSIEGYLDERYRKIEEAKRLEQKKIEAEILEKKRLEANIQKQKRLESERQAEKEKAEKERIKLQAKREREEEIRKQIEENSPEKIREREVEKRERLESEKEWIEQKYKYSRKTYFRHTFFYTIFFILTVLSVLYLFIYADNLFIGLIPIIINGSMVHWLNSEYIDSRRYYFECKELYLKQ